MSQPLINGIQHSWASITVNLLGRNVTGIVAIDYDVEREIEDGYGAGDEPVYRAFGNRKYKASITLYQYEVVGLQQAAGGNLDMIPPFDIPVHFAPAEGAAAVVDIIRNCTIRTNGRSWKQGDTKQEIKLDLQPAGIKFHNS